MLVPLWAQKQFSSGPEWCRWNWVFLSVRSQVVAFLLDIIFLKILVAEEHPVYLLPEGAIFTDVQDISGYGFGQLADIVETLQVQELSFLIIKTIFQHPPGLLTGFIEHANCLALADGLDMIFFILVQQEDGFQGDTVLHIPAAPLPPKHEG